MISKSDPGKSNQERTPKTKSTMISRLDPGKSNQERTPKTKSTMISSKKKCTRMTRISRQMKKRNPWRGQNGQLVHDWLLVHTGRLE